MSGSPFDPDTLDRLEALSARWREGSDLTALARELCLDVDDARRFLVAQRRLRLAAPAEVGGEVGGYRLLAELGQGAMGSVYRAAARDGQQVALKVLRPSGNAARFAREARVLERLHHPNVVRFVAAGHERGRPWLAMELIDGPNLEVVLARGALQPESARAICAEIARALEYAHARGVTHRDLKPANVLLAPDGRAVVTDFGVARVCEESGLTQTGALVGTPLFMAPEQIGGQRVSPAADTWALGAVLFQALAGAPPFTGQSLTELIHAIVSQPCPPLPVAVPLDLRELVAACLQHDPQARPSPGEVAARLTPSVAPRGHLGAWTVGAALTLALALALAGAWLLRGDGPPRPTGDPGSVAWSPAIPEGMQRAWSLGDSQARIDAPALWRTPGRVADPLRGAREESTGALAAAFVGEVEALGEGRVRVRYAPPEGCRYELQRPTADLEPFFTEDGLRYERAACRRQAGEFAVTIPDDHGDITLRLGRADWSHAALEGEARALPQPQPGVYRALTFALGQGPHRERARISLAGRLRRVVVGSGSQAVGHFVLPPSWTHFLLAPGAPSGHRVRIGEDHVDEGRFDAALEAAAPVGGAFLSVGEERAGFRQLEVRGVPLSVDRPALAWAPVGGGTHCAIAARFRQGAGAATRGALLVLGTSTLHYELQLAGDELLLARGERVLGRARLEREPQEGWLQLTREGDRVRGSIGDRRGPLKGIDLVDPLPLGAGEVGLGYGSLGAEVEFAEVEVQRATVDPARARHDAGEDLSETPMGRWRRAAADLQALVFPPPGEDALPLEPRWLRAGELGAALDAVALQLEGAARGDALARATLAWVVAERPEEASRAAKALLELEGPRAAERLDWLAVYLGEPVLLEALARGYCVPQLRRPRLLAAACGVVLAVQAAGKPRQLALQHLADHLERSPETLGRALELLEEAARLDPEDWELRVRAARVVASLGRPAEALERLERAQAPADAVMPYVIRLRALVALGRREDAVEAMAGLLNRDPGYLLQILEADPRSGSLRDSSLVEFLLGAEHAHRAAAALLVSRIDGLPAKEVEHWRYQAETHAHQGARVGTPRESALAAYVQASATGVPELGEMMDQQAPQVPMEVLLRARLGDAQARTDLAAAGSEDAFVLELARSDPQLEPWTR